MRPLVGFVCGFLFAVGLAVSGMSQPSKVLGFLDVTGAWDPSLAFVMVGGIGGRRAGAPLGADEAALRSLLSDASSPRDRSPPRSRLRALRRRLGTRRILSGPGAGGARGHGPRLVALLRRDAPRYGRLRIYKIETCRSASRRVDSGHGAASRARFVRPPLRARRLRARLRRDAQPQPPRTTSSSRRSRSSSTSTHRGAAGCDPCTGDGAGILLQIPHDFYAARARGVGGFELPAPGDYAVAMCFFSRDPARRRQQEAILEAAVVHHGQRVLGWRDVPDRSASPSARSRASRCRSMRQLFIGATVSDVDAFERTLYHDPQARRPPRARRARRRRLLRRVAARRRPSSTRASCSPSRSRRSTPTSATTRCTLAARDGALALLDQHVPHRGSARIRSASSRTTARSTRCRGNRAWMRAREALLKSDAVRRSTSRTSSRSSGRAARTRRRSTTSSTSSSRAGARCRT